MFAGTLQAAVDPHGRLSRGQAETALRVADAEDVFDGMYGGWQGGSTSAAGACRAASVSGSCWRGRWAAQS